jgi:hypothetical protein
MNKVAKWLRDLQGAAVSLEEFLEVCKIASRSSENAVQYFKVLDPKLVAMIHKFGFQALPACTRLTAEVKLGEDKECQAEYFDKALSFSALTLLSMSVVMQEMSGGAAGARCSVRRAAAAHMRRVAVNSRFCGGVIQPDLSASAWHCVHRLLRKQSRAAAGTTSCGRVTAM